MIKKIRNENKSELFLPSLFDSQNCERSFRQFRSMGTVDFTKINFSLYELLHMIGRIEVLNDIAYIKLANEPINFPNKRTGKTVTYALPTDNEIDVTLLKAKEEAINDARSFGMTEFHNIDIFSIETNIQLSDNTIDYDNGDEDNDKEMKLGIEIETNETEADMEKERDEDKGTGFDDEEIGEKSIFTIVTDEDGIKWKVRKSSLVWMLTDPSTSLSKDRLRRFKAVSKKK